ncbi:MAG TPA: hypothetical protein VK824_11260, partial [Planctomycetota bacterium]|nr:hypothetical protein [Planctomycetota bacterium]
MPLNASVLCLLVALAIGGAAALLGLDACRLASAALPGLQPAASSTAPGLCLAWAAGLAVSALRRRRTPLVLGGSGRAAGSAAIAGRWLAAAAAGAFGAPPWLAAWTSPTPPLSEPLRAVAAALPFAPALFCLGAALPPLLAVRARGAALTRGVLGPLLAWLALGAVAAGWRWLPLLAAGARPTDLAAGVLAAAALLCGALAGAAPPDRPQAAGGPSRAPRGVRAWAAELELVVTGAACGLVLPALLQMAAVTGGDNLATRGELALLLACGALLGTLLAATPERTDLLGAALAWIVFAQWAPHVPEPSARFGGGLRALLPALLPTLLVVDTLIRAADRALATQPETGDAATGAPATLPHADGASRRGWALRCALLVGALGAGAAACSALSSGARGHGAPELLRACG